MTGTFHGSQGQVCLVLSFTRFFDVFLCLVKVLFRGPGLRNRERFLRPGGRRFRGSGRRKRDCGFYEGNVDQGEGFLLLFPGRERQRASGVYRKEEETPVKTYRSAYHQGKQSMLVHL
jgi:hypothetical protein